MGGGGHGHAAPQVRINYNGGSNDHIFSHLPLASPHSYQYTGIEASVRAYFPEGYHLAYMVLGGYATIIALSQIRGSFASAAKVAAIPAPEAPDYHTRESSTFFLLVC